MVTAPDGTPSDLPAGLAALLAVARGHDDATMSRRPAPVDRWDPPYCGEIGLAIRADGTWTYRDSPITRPALVRLFASVLKREDAYFLVTPVEKVGIAVEDVPFLAVEMAVEGEGEGRTIAVRTQVDDVVTAGPDHPLTARRQPDGGLVPYIAVRGGMAARFTRALAYDLLSMGEEREVGGDPWFGVAAGGRFHALLPVANTTPGDGKGGDVSGPGTPSERDA